MKAKRPSKASLGRPVHREPELQASEANARGPHGHEPLRPITPRTRQGHGLPSGPRPGPEVARQTPPPAALRVMRPSHDPPETREAFRELDAYTLNP